MMFLAGHSADVWASLGFDRAGATGVSQSVPMKLIEDELLSLGVLPLILVLPHSMLLAKTGYSGLGLEMALVSFNLDLVLGAAMVPDACLDPSFDLAFGVASDSMVDSAFGMSIVPDANLGPFFALVFGVATVPDTCFDEEPSMAVGITWSITSRKFPQPEGCCLMIIFLKRLILTSLIWGSYSIAERFFYFIRNN